MQIVDIIENTISRFPKEYVFTYSDVDVEVQF
jgi:hypothetical protein